ncbi:unnamed protein product [Amoebophrya sp. A120]|nr:unnamed protein product [Amoebophrya sp. A120]|eukprot:GSA120T00022593001.1
MGGTTSRAVNLSAEFHLNEVAAQQEHDACLGLFGGIKTKNVNELATVLAPTSSRTSTTTTNLLSNFFDKTSFFTRTTTTTTSSTAPGRGAAGTAAAAAAERTTNKKTCFCDGAAPNASLLRRYHLFIDTDPCRTCGTQGAAYVRIGGRSSETGYRLLKRGFPPASRFEMDIYAPDVGRVQYLKLASHTRDAWLPRRVFLENPETGGMLEFPAGQRVGEPNTPELTIYPELEESRKDD